MKIEAFDNVWDAPAKGIRLGGLDSPGWLFVVGSGVSRRAPES
jgi:hypothetical protein